MKILSQDFHYSFTDDFLVQDGVSFYNQVQAKGERDGSSMAVSVPYRQCFGTDFVPNLSVLDLLMNHGRLGLKVMLVLFGDFGTKMKN